jgi:ADP-ribose pyrophosphatase YjhB (NUDIX family)
MEPAPKAHTICSAIIQRSDGRIAFKEEKTPTGKKLSLPGGYVDWGLGFPEAIVDRVRSQNRVKFLPLEINGITQNFSPSGKWVTNINVLGPLISNLDETGIYWLSLDEALKKEDDFRTPDTHVLLRKLYQQTPFKLDFVCLTIPQTNSRKYFGFSNEPTDFNVASTVVRYDLPRNAEYAFMICGEGERESVRGKLSLFGGHLADGERTTCASARETCEESTKYIGPQIGLVGAFISQSSSGMYVVNFATAAHGIERPHLRKHKKREAAGVRFLTAPEIYNMPITEFRTPDTLLATLLTDHILKSGRKLVPLESIDCIK